MALPCYPGPDYDEAACAIVLVGWYDGDFVSRNPIGLDYPENITCPPIQVTANSTVTAESCTLGTNPWFAVNVTTTDDIAATLQFAEKNDLRVVIKSTGHDILGRSDGYGSLEVWLRYFRNGITFQSEYEPATLGCTASNWTGAAMKLAGAYMWGEAYDAAAENNVVVVGGGSSTVCSTGGWVQGGGHGPASHTFGLGADQVLDVEVMLANGTLVLANACQNQDIYSAIRGGGPSTYGVVVSTTVKAHPQLYATVQILSFAPLDGTSNDTFLDALTELYLTVPELVDAGFAGYTHWQVDGLSAIVDNYTTGYTHSIYVFNQTEETAVAAGQTLLDKINQYNESLYISSSYVSYSDYWSFFKNTSVDDNPVGVQAASGSRLLDSKALSDFTTVRNLVGVLAGAEGEHVTNVMSIVSGGKVAEDASDIYSSVLPAWRTAIIHQTVARVFIGDLTEDEKQEIYDDITYTKIGAMKTLAPDTGAYMNEGDFNDPDWMVDFFGENYSRLQGIKSTYDPNSLFYCPTCVGSDKWHTDSVGRLCTV